MYSFGGQRFSLMRALLGSPFWGTLLKYIKKYHFELPREQKKDSVGYSRHQFVTTGFISYLLRSTKANTTKQQT